jgi:hypothetical protein
MKKNITIIVLLLSFLAVTTEQTFTKNAAPRNVTGQYRLRQEEFHNRLDVLQLPGGKIKFQLVALWVSHNNPENIHNGELRGEVTLRNGLATLPGNCKITMTFTANKVVVTEGEETEACGFGANVTAAGSYRKIDSKKPKFDF